MARHSHNQSGFSSAQNSKASEAGGGLKGRENHEESGGTVNTEAFSDSANTDKKAAPATPEGKISSLEDDLAKKILESAEQEAKIADLNDQILRKAADFENYRKRMVREKQELTDFANQSLLLDLLPVIDDFERAIKSAETSRDFASFYQGVTMIEKSLSSQLEKKWGLKRFDSEGELFDPNRHEAIQMEKSSSVPEAVVKEDYVKGYFLKDRVIRFAKVKVIVPESPSSGAVEPGSEVKGNDGGV